MFGLLVDGVLLAAVGYVAAVALWRLRFGPLARLPGPRLAALSLWYEFYYDVIGRGTYMWRIKRMHDKYGPCVRINPYEVHINDPDFFDELYVHTKKLDKYQWWTNLAGSPGSSFATVPHELHRRRRGALNPFFSVRSVSELEPLIRSKIDKLCRRLEALAKSKHVVRFDVAFMALTMDIISDYSFAMDPKYLEEPDFHLEWKETIINAMESGALARQFPWMASAMSALPLSAVSVIHPPMANLLIWRNGVADRVRPILAGTDELSRSKQNTTSRTIFHALRDSDLPPEEKTLGRLCDEGQILTGAGSETTAQTLTRLFFYLRQEPKVLRNLRSELDNAISGDVPSWVELQQLPYLSAVVKEALRLSYGVTTRLPRVAREDIYYKEHFIPAGTPISQTLYFVLMDPTVFPEPETFRPERWLEAEAQGVKLDRYLVSFGKGTRQCLGMNLAYAELYLTTATVVRRFDWTMYETTLNDIVCKHDFFVAVADVNSKGVRATISMRET